MRCSALVNVGTSGYLVQRFNKKPLRLYAEWFCYWRYLLGVAFGCSISLLLLTIPFAQRAMVVTCSSFDYPHDSAYHTTHTQKN